MNYINKTLAELEGIEKIEPEFQSSLVLKINELLVKPLKDFSIEDLRIIIGQNMFLEWLIPIALIKLRQDIFAESKDYGYFLIKTVLGVENKFWEEHKNLKEELMQIINGNIEEIKTPSKLTGEELSDYLEGSLPELEKLIARFKKS